MAKNVAIEISASNIGPLGSPSYMGKKKASNTTVLYARNGSGKTFLSRMFRLMEDKTSSKTENLLTFGSREGSFSFCIAENTGQRVATVELRTGEDPKISNGPDLLFHVFNSDFVRDSVEKTGYSAPGNISGYIVGKENIDTSKERAEVERLEGELSSSFARIEAAVTSVRNEVKASGVGSNLGAFRDITVENILTDSLPLTETYSAQLDSLRKLSNIPDDDATLGLPPVRCEDGLTSRLRELLTTPFKREDFAQEFVERVSAHVDFVREGMAALAEDGSVCPFCGQHIGPDAAELIHLYEEYLAAAEAKARAEIERVDRQLADLEREASLWGSRAYLTSSGLREAVGTYPSLSGLEQPHNPGPDRLLSAIRSARGALLDKARKLDEPLPGDPADEIGNALSEIREYEEGVAPLLVSANNAKSNIAREKRECRNLLCSQARAKLRISLEGEINARARLESELAASKERFRTLEESCRQPRRARVAEIFEGLLRDFFGDKYAFDADTFIISLGAHEMSRDSDLVLSEGEKTIVAFCIYLASTVQLINSFRDWYRLFFVIDDPISSLDYDYVYTMVGCIFSIARKLGMGEDERLRFLVLTHNYSFFNILATSGAVSNRLVLEHGGIRDASDDEIFPFEQHLADVIRVAEGDSPSHTTGNSIRHVLEWAWHIQRPELGSLGKYVGQAERLRADSALYYICNDLSHGCHERAAGDFSEDLATSCKTVLSFMEREFEGQVKNVRTRFLNP